MVELAVAEALVAGAELAESVASEEQADSYNQEFVIDLVVAYRDILVVSAEWVALAEWVVLVVRVESVVLAELVSEAESFGPAVSAEKAELTAKVAEAYPIQQLISDIE